jgi:hypothetical protein
MKIFLVLFVVFSCVLNACSQPSSKITATEFNVFDKHPVPAGMGEPKATWNATGTDPFGNLYVVYGDEKGTRGSVRNSSGNDYSDCVFVQFNTKTEEFNVVGSLVEALKAENNWHPGEFVEKGHTPLPYMHGKIYMGTMEFHSIEGRRDAVIKEMEKYRGSHLLSYDVKSGEIKDVTKDLPGGVLFPNQGMIACDAWPEYNYIVCMSTPRGDIALYNTLTEKVDAIIPGPDEELGNVIYRKIIPTPSGKAYFGFKGFKKDEGSLYVLDIKTKTITKKMNLPKINFRGFVHNQERTQFYVISEFGEIISINDLTDEVKVLGNIVPNDEYAFLEEEDNIAVSTGLVLSPDNKKLFSIPSIKIEIDINSTEGRIRRNGKRYAGTKALGLYEFDLSNNTSQKIYDFSESKELRLNDGDLTAKISGSGMIDEQGRIYFARNSKPAFLRIDVSSRIDPAYLSK